MATVPSAITLLFRPNIRQLLPEQETVLLALFAEGPATMLKPVISEEKLNDHWRPAGCAPPNDARLMGRAIVPPGTAEPDPMESVTL